MEPNVFWQTKDWKEQWEVADIQGLLAQAQAAGGDRFAFHDVPSRSFSDSDTIAIGPAEMQYDEDTAVLLHDLSAVPVPGTDLELDVEVHWDGTQFWLRPTCSDECLDLLKAAPGTETINRLMQVRNGWLKEQAYRELVEQAARDE